MVAKMAAEKSETGKSEKIREHNEVYYVGFCLANKSEMGIIFRRVVVWFTNISLVTIRVRFPIHHRMSRHVLYGTFNMSTVAQ